MESKLNVIEESAIPKHGQTSVVQRYLDEIVIPDINFEQVCFNIYTANGRIRMCYVGKDFFNMENRTTERLMSFICD